MNDDEFDYRRAWLEAQRVRGAEAGMVAGGIERPFPVAGLRPGDPPEPGSSRNQWAGRLLLANTASAFRIPGTGAGTPVGVQGGVLVSTDDLGSPGLMLIELRFSNPDAVGNPTIWSPLTTFRTRIDVARGMDPQSPAQTDSYIVDSTGATGDPIQWLAIQTVTAQQLTISVTLDVAPGGNQAQWCEAIITLVTTPNYDPAARGQANIFGAGMAGTSRVDVDQADPGTLVLTQRAWRTGFILHNPNTTDEPTALNIMVRFGAPVASDRTVYGFILTPGQTYEAFPKYWWGAVYARTAAGESGSSPLLVTSIQTIGAGGF